MFKSVRGLVSLLIRDFDKNINLVYDVMESLPMEERKKVISGTIGRIIKMHHDGSIRNLDWKPNGFSCETGRLVNFFARGDYESWRQYWLLEAEDENSAQALVSQYIGWDTGYSHCLPGQAFASPMSLWKVGENRFLVYQSGGLDV